MNNTPLNASPINGAASQVPTVTPGTAVLTFQHNQPEVTVSAIEAAPALPEVPELSSWIYLVEMEAATGFFSDGDGPINGFGINDTLDAESTVETTTLRFTNSSMGYATRPGEAPANAQYDNCLQQPGYVQREVAVGAIAENFGEVSLASVGHLDGLLNYGLDGRTITIRRGPLGGVYPADFPVRLIATMEQPEFLATTVRVKLRDRMSILELPLQPTLYAGTNVLPDGIEGTEDLKGTVKPTIFGRVMNMSPILVNTARLIYQAHCGELADLPAVYDKGAALSRGADYASELDMQTNAPAPGQFRVWLGGGCFRLGATPLGQVTCDAAEGALTVDRYPGALLARIARYVGVTEIDLVDVLTLDTFTPAEVGVVVNGNEATSSVMSRVATGIGAWFGFDRLNYLRMGRLQAPAGEPIVDLDASCITDIERTAQSDVPKWRITLKYARNNTVQNSDVAGSVTTERKAWLTQEWRTATAEKPDVKRLHLMSGELERESGFVWQTDAQLEADRLLDLYSVRRDTFHVNARLSAGQTDRIDLGDVVRLTWPRFGLHLGRLFVVTGQKIDFGGDAVELTLWG